MPEKFIEIIISILSLFIGDELLQKIADKMRGKQFRVMFLGSLFAVFIVVLVILNVSSVTVTKVMVSKETLTMGINDTNKLAATVLYSDNSVLWTSSNETVAIIDKNGNITALADGTTTITAQASRNNSTESAECILTIKSPPSGYRITVRQTAADSYAYVYVEPYEDDVTKIQIYGKSPSGEIFTPVKDENDLYHFYSECGTWTVYASVENDAGVYMANKAEDYATIEVTNIFTSQTYQDVFLDFGKKYKEILSGYY